MSAWLRARWRYLLAAVALVALIQYVGTDALWATLRSARPGPLLLYLGAFAVVPLLFANQMHRALRIAGHHVPASRTLTAAVTAWSVGTLTPARAGDLSLSFLLRDVVAEGESVAIVVADKLVSLAVLAALAILSVTFVDVPQGATVVVGAAGVLAMVGVIFLLLRQPYVDTPLRRWAARLVGARVTGAWDGLRDTLRVPGLLPWTVAAATLRWVYICSINLIIFRAVSESPGLGHVIAATAVGRILSLIPVTVGGLGVKEPAQIVIYAGAGVPAEAVVAVSVLGMACGFVVAAVLPLLIGAARRPRGR